jgi:hypothetical protein
MTSCTLVEVHTDVLERHSAGFIRVKEKAKQEAGGEQHFLPVTLLIFNCEDQIGVLEIETTICTSCVQQVRDGSCYKHCIMRKQYIIIWFKLYQLLFVNYFVQKTSSAI